MNKRCAVCGKLFQNDIRISMENGKEMCEDCWKAFEGEDISENENTEEFEKLDIDDSTIEINGKEYEGSGTATWSNHVARLCYISWVVYTVVGAIIGGLIFSLDWNTFVGVLLGGFVGFMIGFTQIAFLMMLVTMHDNIATMTDNTARILAKLDEK